MILLNSKKRLITLLIVLVFGIIIFILGLGTTGLVDETPPLFAAAARAMSESGDWLTPKVNGMFRFDKPPLIYWLMGFFYSLPKNEIWDSFGTLSARLPSALASLFLMLMIGDTLFCWPQKSDRQFLTPIVASLGFALSPLIIIWSRTAVSDALLTGTLGISLLLFWRRMASENDDQCISAWVFLGFAILTKGPVAFVLALLTIASFLFSQKNWKTLLGKINPKKGFLITILISVPWYILELIKEGMFDKLHEPYRWKLIKGGLDVKDAALNAGALGCAISGAGPSILALCKKENGKNVSQAMVKAWEKSGVASRAPFLNVQTTGSQFSTISGK